MRQQAYEPREIWKDRILPISRTMLYRMIANGELKSVRVGRKILVPAWALEEFLKKTN